MAVYSIAKLSELEGEKRIDAEYYKPAYDLLKFLFKYKITKLGKISHIAYGTTPPGGIFQDEGVEFIRSQNFINGIVNKSDIVYCSLDFHKKNIKSSVRPGDILFAAVGGTIGEVALVQNSIQEGNINQNIARVRILNPNINPYFVGLFFLTNFGQLQIFRLITGNAQSYLNSFQIGSLVVPLLSKQLQDEVKKIFLKVEKTFDDSYSLYSQAENLLLEELGLKDYKPQYKKTYTAKVSDALSARRIDAEYFQPAYEEVIERIREKGVEIFLLKDIFDFKRGLFIPTIYYSNTKTSRPYIRIKELTGKIGIDEEKIIYIKDDYPNDEINKLEKNDIVIAIIGDTIGKANRIYQDLAGGFCSNNTARLRIKLKDKVLPEYAEILFQSLPVQKQIEKKKAQTGQPKISDNEIKTIMIPVLPYSIQHQIAELVQKSHQARKKAKELLEIAKRAVEIAIEKSEEEALNFISSA